MVFLAPPDLGGAELADQEFTGYVGWQWPNDVGYRAASNPKSGSVYLDRITHVPVRKSIEHRGSVGSRRQIF